MPLYKKITHNTHTQILVWEITESLEVLSRNLALTQRSSSRLENMHSEVHQKGFLAVRHLLKMLHYTDTDLFYTEDGKPHLKDGKRISISHSFSFAVIAVSDTPIGVDIEKNRKKIIKIAPKFVADEYDFMAEDSVVDFLTVVWGAKESLYKIHPDGGLLFKHHLPIEPFKLTDKKTTGWIKKEPFYEKFYIYVEKIKNFTLVYASNSLKISP